MWPLPHPRTPKSGIIYFRGHSSLIICMLPRKKLGCAMHFRRFSMASTHFSACKIDTKYHRARHAPPLSYQRTPKSGITWFWGPSSMIVRMFQIKKLGFAMHFSRFSMAATQNGLLIYQIVRTLQA